jgi:hypothetical protein
MNDGKIGSGKSPEGKPVTYFHYGGKIEVKEGDGGEKLTHSDSVKGLRDAGFEVNLDPEPPRPASEAEVIDSLNKQLDFALAERDTARAERDELARKLAEITKGGQDKQPETANAA